MPGPLTTSINKGNTLAGKAVITLSTLGWTVTGDSGLPTNNGCDFGPDTPGTVTFGVNEAFAYQAANSVPIIVKDGPIVYEGTTFPAGSIISPPGSTGSGSASVVVGPAGSAYPVTSTPTTGGAAATINAAITAVAAKGGGVVALTGGPGTTFWTEAPVHFLDQVDIQSDGVSISPMNGAAFTPVIGNTAAQNLTALTYTGLSINANAANSGYTPQAASWPGFNTTYVFPPLVGTLAGVTDPLGGGTILLYFAGGTVTGYTLNGLAVSQTSGSVYLTPSDTLTFQGSIAPTTFTYAQNIDGGWFYHSNFTRWIACVPWISGQVSGGYSGATAGSAGVMVSFNSAPNWVSGNNYVVGNVVIALAVKTGYQCILGITDSTTDPSSDSTHWKSIKLNQCASQLIDIDSGKANLSPNNNYWCAGVRFYGASGNATANMRITNIATQFTFYRGGDWVQYCDTHNAEQGTMRFPAGASSANVAQYVCIWMGSSGTVSNPVAIDRTYLGAVIADNTVAANVAYVVLGYYNAVNPSVPAATGVISPSFSISKLTNPNAVVVTDLRGTYLTGIQAWSSSTTYGVGATVSSGGSNYVSIVGSNLNNVPPNTSFWGVLSVGSPDYDIINVTGNVRYRAATSGQNSGSGAAQGLQQQVAVPATTVPTASFPYMVIYYIRTVGTVTAVTLTDPAGTAKALLPAALSVGQVIIVPPGATLTLTYSGAPTWWSYKIGIG
jgi:hypothetical protein